MRTRHDDTTHEFVYVDGAWCMVRVGDKRRPSSEAECQAAAGEEDQSSSGWDDVA